MHNRPTHFEIQASDTNRAVKFYTDVFGWEIAKWENPGMEYWMVMTAPKGSTDPGINGGLLKRPGGEPVDMAAVNAFVCTVQVDNYDDIHAKIMAAGGTVALPKMAFAGMAWQGYYKDTEGNIFGLHQTDTNAK
ncbi:MAG: hypothetical protein RLZZ283_161 [Candidatus Parcubacteria bacterium]|jgi:predicted enzyme related to lactoylglutathione lyase